MIITGKIKNLPGGPEGVLILLIMIAGALLRFWRISEIPFTHDEFSALLRTRFDSFGDLIRGGVIIDGHPAGVQVFLYYYVKWFGVSEAGIKLPFLIAGTLSVGLVYLIGREWFGGTAGLAAASFLAYLQFPVMYSQIARPYASGLFLGLLMVWFWTRAVFHPERKFAANLAGYSLTGALCLYNHHFTLLFATMVAVTGIIFISRERRRRYLLATAVIFLLYLPHLSIFLHQLGVGGVEGWLQKPRFDFITDFIEYAFHFSVFTGLLVLTLISLALYWDGDPPRGRVKFFLISLAWFVIPWMTGYLYSVFRSSVLQYSVLLFSFPYLLFLITGWLTTPVPRHQAAIAGLIALVAIPSLIIERQHYRLFYKGAYETIVRSAMSAEDTLGPHRCAILLDTRPEINDYYLDKYHCRNLVFSYIDPAWDKGKVNQILDTCRGSYLALGGISSTRLEHYPMILERFPGLIRHDCLAGGDFYLFSKEPSDRGLNEYFYSVTNTFEPSLPGWGWIDGKRCTDSLAIAGERSYLVAAGEEFSPTYTQNLRSMIRSDNDIIDVMAELRLPAVFPGAWLVVTVSAGGKDLKWCAAPVNDFIGPGKSGKVFQSLRISDVDMRHHGMTFRAYLWNPVKTPFLLDNFTVKVRSGNPVVYGLYRNI